MDIAIALNRILPGAEYTGSVTANTEQTYDNIFWIDVRSKPTWQELLDSWDEYLEEGNFRAYKIYDYVHDYDRDKNILPVRIDFITGLTLRLHPKHSFTFGQLDQTIYYASAWLEQDGTITYSIPVVKETYTYTRDEIGFPIYRKTEIQWYYEDGELGSTKKTLEKFYVDDPISSLNELARRRDNNIKNIIGAIIQLAIASDPLLTKTDILEQGRSFFNNSSTNRDLYINDGNLALVDDVRNELSIEWFDNDVSGLIGLPTIRSFIIYQLTMGSETS